MTEPAATGDVVDVTTRLEQQRRAAIPLTDYGNAERLVLDHGHDLLHVGARADRGWHVWDGQRWRPDDDGAIVRLAKATVRGMREEAARMPEGGAREELWKHANRSEQGPRLDALVRLAASEQAVIAGADQLDADPWLLNVTNGTIDLRTGDLHPHRRTDRITKLAPVIHDPDARCPRWKDAVATWTDGDTDLARFLQRAVGYTLTGDTREQVLFLLHGDGANGKSTFIETVHRLLGDYAARADMTTWTTGHKRGVRSDIARLHGARYVPAVEIEGDARLAASLIKQVTGGDTIVASHLYQEEFEYRPQFKVWLAVNDLPDTHDDSHAMWRRLHVIPFTNRIARPDTRLPHHLRDELPGILNWALAGCADWQTHGLGHPAPVQAATAAHRQATDHVAQFIADRCTLDPDRLAPSATLWDAFQTWADDHDVTHHLSRKGFAGRLTTHGLTAHVTRINGRQVRVWTGLALAERDA